MHFLTLCILFLCIGCQSKPLNDKSTLRLGINKDPTTIDPRKSFANDISNIMMMLYDGLMRYDQNHELSFGLAEKVHISKDKKEYTFTLRNAKWSDGSQISAYDFERSWKTILNKDFPSIYPHKFYMIVNAENAKMGKASPDEIGIKALNANTLFVKLQHPTPYFLQQLAYSIAFAVHKEDSHFEKNPESLAFSGPFVLERWKHNDHITLKKNPYYWDKKSVRLEKIELNIIDNPITLLNLFENREIDFMGEPFSNIPFDARPSLDKKGLLNYFPSNGTVFLEFNTERFPFTNKNIRKALSISINRNEIEQNILNKHAKATQRLVPSEVTYPLFDSTAKEYLDRGLSELNIKKEDLNISFVFKDEEATKKIAQVLQQNWKEELGITVKLEKQVWRNYIQNFTEKNYQIFQICWTCDVNDPIFLLNIFRLKFGTADKPRWQNSQFQTLLSKSDRCFDEQDRGQLLIDAENLLLNECIIAPIFHYFSQCIHTPNLKNIQHYESGYVDFRWAYFE